MKRTLVLLCLLLCTVAQAELRVPLLANFKFRGNGNDSAHNSPPMNYGQLSIVRGALEIPITNDNYNTKAYIPGLNYSNFAVAVDFSAYDFNEWFHRTIICGGPSYRWLQIGVVGNGQLALMLNNGNRPYVFTNVLTTNRWHTIVCSVDLTARRLLLALDKELVGEFTLDEFEFQVIGTEYEELDKAFLFENRGNLSFLVGHVDNLRVYERALTTEELLKVKAHPRTRTRPAR